MILLWHLNAMILKNKKRQLTDLSAYISKNYMNLVVNLYSYYKINSTSITNYINIKKTIIYFTFLLFDEL